MADNHTYHEAAWLAWGRENGHPISHDYYREHIHSRSNLVITRAILGNAWTPEALAQIEADKESLYRELYREHVTEVPGLLGILRALHEAGVPIAASSNSPRPNVDLVLGELGVSDWFDAVFTPCGGIAGKPAPDLFLAASEALQLPPSRCLVFEDSISGFQAAEAGGFPFVAITQGANPSCLAHTGGAAMVCRDFTGLTLAGLQELL
jgi:HAD superfamily hydrolase (TIGR01509 family)